MKTPALNDNEIQQVLRILRINGQGPDAVRKVAQQYHIAESVVTAMGKIITEGADAILTEQPATPAEPTNSPQEVRQRFLADKLAAQVQSAESKPLHQASTQELEALAVAYTS